LKLPGGGTDVAQQFLFMPYLYHLPSANAVQKMGCSLEQVGDKYVARKMDIYRLVNFLAAIRPRGRVHEGKVAINLKALA
jgi:hypothetical protein